jgi:acyl-CoA reductase-like NAD-dependent aldehyde dehydrogenase
MGLFQSHGRGRRVLRRAQLRGAGAIREAGSGIVIVVHSFAQAVAALTAAARAGQRVVLASAPGAASYLGPGWFAALIDAAREAVPGAKHAALLDCDDDIGAALAAIRSEIDGVVFTGRRDVSRRLADIAGQHGVRLVTDRPPAALDLGDDFFASPDVLECRCAGVLRTPAEDRAAG